MRRATFGLRAKGCPCLRALDDQMKAALRGLFETHVAIDPPETGPCPECLARNGRALQHRLVHGARHPGLLPSRPRGHNLLDDWLDSPCAGNGLDRPALAHTRAGVIFQLRTEVQGVTPTQSAASQWRPVRIGVRSGEESSNVLSNMLAPPRGFGRLRLTRARPEARSPASCLSLILTPGTVQLFQLFSVGFVH